MDLNTVTDPERLRQWLEAALAWMGANLLALGNLAQLGAILAAYVAARVLSPRLEALLDRHPDVHWYARFGAPVAAAVKPVARPVLWLCLLWFAVVAAKGAAWPHQIMEGAVSLLTAWAVIRLASSFIRNPFWARAVAVTAWSIAALNLLGILEPVMQTLDRMALSAGDFRISVLGIVKTALISALFLYLASVASRLAEARINASANLTPSMRVLFGKLARVSLFTVAIVVALQTVGLNLTSFAVFSGAVGLGVGFGLQKVVSNLMSGVILLMDRSVKPGDVIAIGDTFGWINTLGARYVSVITRDGTEHLIPNEELISQRVENWSFSNQLVRQKVPIGIDYGADVHLARELALKAAEGVERILKEPRPVCHLMAFGDNSVNLELRFWINDPQNGVANVRSAVQLRIWDLYHEHGVVFPFPQRDLHLRSSVPIRVEVAARPAGGDGEA